MTQQEENKIREEWYKTDLVKKFAPFEMAVPDFFLDVIKQRDEKIIKEINKLKEAVESTGTFKYSECYDECIEIIKNV